LFTPFIILDLIFNTTAKEWKTLAPNRIKINQEIYINSMLFADDQIILATENSLQKSLHILNINALRYNFKTSGKKTKVLAFVRSQSHK
jgi:hypothetical protein